jgi:hypothetical protein
MRKRKKRKRIPTSDSPQENPRKRRKIVTKKKSGTKRKRPVYREHKLRCNYHTWNTEHSHDSIISSGTPYTNMKPSKAKFVQREGYQKGFPDYSRYNPTLSIYKSSSGKLRIKVCPAMFIEFKNPKTGGKLSEDQERVLSTLDSRGYRCIVSNDLEFTQDETEKYDKRLPFYKGFVEIDFDNEVVSIPRRYGGRKRFDIEDLPTERPTVIVID